jgi:hypothetical protein
MPAVSRKREWCWTLHNYSPAFWARVVVLVEREPTLFTYLCWQAELCPTTQSKHLQGYVCFATPRTMRGAKTAFFLQCSDNGDTVHLAPANGSALENREYCSKEESRDPESHRPFTEHGDIGGCPVRAGQGARNDLHAASVRIRSGDSLRDIANDAPDLWVRYHRGFASLQSIVFAPQRVRELLPDGGPLNFGYPPISVIWLYGSTGSGKTRHVYDTHPDEDIFIKQPGNKWFCGYRGQSIALFDDFRGNWWTFAYFLRVLDRYPLTVETKGGTCEWCAKTIYITCPTKPEYVYPSQLGQLEQLTRRISQTILFGEEPAPPDAPAPFAPGFMPPPHVL